MDSELPPPISDKQKSLLSYRYSVYREAVMIYQKQSIAIVVGNQVIPIQRGGKRFSNISYLKGVDIREISVPGADMR